MENSVDVIIPTYMETVRLVEAVKSCKAQTHQPNKIIIVDDGSDENTKLWIKNEFSSDPIIHLIFSPHTSLPGVARSIGIDASNARWLAFLDADDSWHEEKLELQLNYATLNDAEFICTNALAIRESQPAVLMLNKIPKIIDFRDLVKTNWVINSSVLVRSNILKEKYEYASSIRVRAVEDFATWLRIATGTKLHALSLPLTNYRVSEESIRSFDVVDPRIHAFADFLIWTQTNRTNNNKMFRKNKKCILKQIAKQYGN
jgi:teichuronic acid biosynthesis glycosyltransferase TuaG